MNNIGIFRDAREALTFALHFDGGNVKSQLGSVTPGAEIGSGRGLFGLNGAATAGTLRRRLEALGRPHTSVLVARATAFNSPAWLAAVGEVTEHLTPMAAGLTINDIAMHQLVRKFFGARVVDRQIADLANIAHITVARQSLKLRPYLERIDAEAWAEWSASLHDTGLV